MHRQFGHPTSPKLIDLVKKAGADREDLCKAIGEVSETCEVCARLKKAPPRPAVSIPLASKFNDAISIDLKFWGSKYFFVIVDVATRFVTATVIDNKQPSTIIRGLFLSWVVIFGTPKKILSDNGREFDNSEMRDLGERFNIKIITTAAESPWSNGVCERQNAVIADGVRKVMADTDCALDVALAWTVSARNALANHSGFSPNQLVFGQNPGLPNVFSDKIPALENISSSDTVRTNLNAMHSARQEFIKFESSDRLKRALRHNVRPTDSSIIENGDEVFYKRNDSPEWRGPGIVIGKDGKVVIVRHGGTYVRVHVCRLSRAPSSASDVPEQLSSNGHGAVATEQGEEVSQTVDTGCPRDELHESVYEPYGSGSVNPDEDEEQDGESNNGDPETSEILDQPTEGESGQPGQFKVKVGQRIRGISKDSGEVFSGKILSRGGKTTGRYKNWFNVQRDDGTFQCMDVMESLCDLEEIQENVEMIVFFNSDEVATAKEKELNSWKENEVFEEVENTGQDTISVRWVVTEKFKEGKAVVKARLVERGYEENTDYLRKDSPTCSKEAVRLAISIASSKGWECHTIDVKSAYLQGNPIGREIFLKPPPEYDCGTLWKLKKTVYGLSDAARQWYLRVRQELLNLGMSTASLDPALFSWHTNDQLEGVICLYVDDFLWAGSPLFKAQIVDRLSDLFLIGTAASKAFKYVGLNIAVANDGCTTVDQFEYTQAIQPIAISSKRAMAKSSDLSEREKAEYRALVGQLNWVATHTRPDIAFDVCELGVNYKEATVSDLIRLNKVIRRLKTDNLRLLFAKVENIEQCRLDCYADASFANLAGCASQGGFIVLLRDSSGKSCPIFWQSRKIRRVVKSTLAAETLALLDCASAAVYIRAVLKEICRCDEIPVYCYTDNKSLLDTLNSNKNVDDRRLRIDLAVLHDMLQRKEVNHIAWVDTSHQLANCLTKRGASVQQLRAAISRD